MKDLLVTIPNIAPRRSVSTRDVVVIRDEDLVDNDPFRSRQIMGIFRKDALAEYRKGNSQNFVFWYASVSGRSYQLDSHNDIDWNN